MTKQKDNYFRIGFTGTRRGMTDFQRLEFVKIVAHLSATHVNQLIEFHQGDCVGSDGQANMIVKNHFGFIRRYGHPPKDTKFRAYSPVDIELEPKEYLERNKDIVDICDVLISTPRQKEQPKNLRGEGTWSTILYAEKKGKKVIKIWPQ